MPLRRVRRKERNTATGAPPGTIPQEDINELVTASSPEQAIYEFEVKRDAKTYNGGMRIDITQPNVQGVQPGALVHQLRVQCKGCDRHPGVEEDDEWVTVTEDYNQSGTYAQAGITAAVNDPQPSGKDGKPVQWRAVVDNPAGPAVRVRDGLHERTRDLGRRDGRRDAAGAAGVQRRLDRLLARRSTATRRRRRGASAR